MINCLSISRFSLILHEKSLGQWRSVQVAGNSRNLNFLTQKSEIRSKRKFYWELGHGELYAIRLFDCSESLLASFGSCFLLFHCLKWTLLICAGVLNILLNLSSIYSHNNMRSSMVSLLDYQYEVLRSVFGVFFSLSPTHYLLKQKCAFAFLAFTIFKQSNFIMDLHKIADACI